MPGSMPLSTTRFCWQVGTEPVVKSQAISDVLKSLFEFSYARNLHLSLVYDPSKENPADGPSRVVSADLRPRKFWWPLVERSASSAFKLGLKGRS